jgi:aryl-alcohol dehydrogenase-like predicted oxidoreductase
MYIHNPGESQLSKVGEKMFKDRLHDAFEYLELARDQEKIKYYGLATWVSFRVSADDPAYINLEDIVELAREVGGKDHGFRFIQLPINLVQPEAMTENTQTVNDEQVILLKAARELGIGVFSSVPLMQSKLLEYRLPEIDNYTPSQVCLEFARSIPEILAPLVGHKKPEHVQSNTELGKMDCLKVDEYKKTFFEKQK